jgi:hypothetical protein
MKELIIKNNFSATIEFKLLIGSLFILSLLSANPIHTLLSLVMLTIIFVLFWTRDIPAIVFWGLVFQWLFITLKVFYADINGFSFTDKILHSYPFAINMAFYLSLYGLLFYMIGLYLITRKSHKFNFDLSSILNYDTKKLIIVYLVFQVIFNILLTLFGLLSGLSQLIVQMSYLRWGFFFLVIYNAFMKKEYRLFVIIILLAEVILSFATYWSSFKEYLIFLIIFIPVLKLKLKLRQYILMSVILCITFFFSLVWQTIKSEYRSYLSHGLTQQVVLVSPQEAIPHFIEMALNTPIDFDHALWTIIDRASYIDFFSATIDHIPDILPFQNGRILYESFYHVLTPRLLFEGKKELDDSKQLNELTGLYMADAQKGTSMSLGYMGEAYADFGPTFMVISTFLIGLLSGLVYRYIFLKSPNTLWFLILVVPFFYLVNVNGMDTNRILGNLGWYFIVAFLIIKFVAPKLDPILR